MIHPTYSKVPERKNRNKPARNTLVDLQLSALYTDHEGHNAQRHRSADKRTDGRTYGQTTRLCQQPITLCKALSTRTVAEKWDCRQKRRENDDSSTFLRQCGQAFIKSSRKKAWQT